MTQWRDGSTKHLLESCSRTLAALRRFSRLTKLCADNICVV